MCGNVPGKKPPRIWAAALGGAAVLALASWAGAAPIGISINVGGNDATHDIPAADSLGVVPLVHWNNLTAAANPSAPPPTLVDSGGSTVASMTVSSTGWNNDTFNAFGTDLQNMYSNFIHTDNGGGGNVHSASITLTNIPYATYDVYIYYNSFTSSNPQAWTESQNSTTLYGLRGPTQGGALGSFVQYQTSSLSTVLADAAGGTAGGNYLEFTGLTAANLTLTVGPDGLTSGYVQEGLAGIQIVAESAPVPEPASTALLCMAVPALLMRRRKRA